MLELLLSTVGAIMLLLYSVQSVREAVEIALIKRVQPEFLKKKLQLIFVFLGTFCSILMQSSSAVTILAASFFTSGSLIFSNAFATVIGADIGSAFVVKLLSFDLSWLTPLLFTIGGWMYLSSKHLALQKIGKIIVSFGFILMALSLLNAALAPVRDSHIATEVLAYLEGDPYTAFAVGALFVIFMHSSVAFLLMCLSLASLGLLSTDLSLALVLGGNLGSSIIPVWIMRRLNGGGSHFVTVCLLIRGSLAVACLLGLQFFDISAITQDFASEQALIWGHISFNMLLLVVLPFSKKLEGLMSLLEQTSITKPITDSGSCLDDVPLTMPSLAIASMRREVIGMAQILTSMARSIPDLYKNLNPERIKALEAQDARLNQTLADIRNFIPLLPYAAMSPYDHRNIQELIEIAVDLEAAGDIVSKQIVKLITCVHRDHIDFSDEGWQELLAMHMQVLENMSMAFGVLTTEDADMAREVIERKAAIRDTEKQSRIRHFERVRGGSLVSIRSSDMHLETLRAFKELNAKVASLSHPLLSREGLLRPTRLDDAI